MCNVFMCVTKHLWAISWIRPVSVQAFTHPGPPGGGAATSSSSVVLDAGTSSVRSDQQFLCSITQIVRDIRGGPRWSWSFVTLPVISGEVSQSGALLGKLFVFEMSKSTRKPCMKLSD